VQTYKKVILYRFHVYRPTAKAKWGEKEREKGET